MTEWHLAPEAEDPRIWEGTCVCGEGLTFSAAVKLNRQDHMLFKFKHDGGWNRELEIRISEFRERDVQELAMDFITEFIASTRRNAMDGSKMYMCMRYKDLGEAWTTLYEL